MLLQKGDGRKGDDGPGTIRRRIVALSVAGLVGAAPVMAQQPAAGAATTDPLAALVADALRSNGRLQAERWATERTAAQVREARSLFLPSVQLDSRYSEQRGTLDLGEFINPAYGALNQVIGDARFPTDLELMLPLRHESRIRLTQPVVDVGLWSNHAAARHRDDAQQWQLAGAARRLAADVQLAYWAAVSAERAVAIYASTLELVRENERVTKRLVDAGRSTPDVLFRARADRSEVEQQLAESEERAAAARRVVNQLAGRDLDTPLDPVPGDLPARALPVTREAALSSALARRDEMKQLDAGMRAAAAGVRAATSSFLPTVAVAVDYGVQGRDVRFNRDADFVIGSLIVSWNLFNGGGDVARRDAARGEAARLRALRGDVETQVRMDVLQAFDAAVIAGDAIATADERVTAARRAYTLVQRRHEEGIASQFELIDARVALTEAELNRSLTEYRYAMRLVDLERAAALRAIDEGRS